MGYDMSSLGHLHVKRRHVLHNIVAGPNSSEQSIYNSCNKYNKWACHASQLPGTEASSPIVASSAGTKLPIYIIR